MSRHGLIALAVVAVLAAAGGAFALGRESRPTAPAPDTAPATIAVEAVEGGRAQLGDAPVPELAGPKQTPTPSPTAAATTAATAVATATSDGVQLPDTPTIPAGPPESDGGGSQPTPAPTFESNSGGAG